MVTLGTGVSGPIPLGIIAATLRTVLPVPHAQNFSVGVVTSPRRRQHRVYARAGQVRPLSTAQAATCAREAKPSLVRMLVTCLATVAGLITSSSAMPLLLRPRAIRRAISRSLAVRVLGGVTGIAWPPRSCRGTRGAGT